MSKITKISRNITPEIFNLFKEGSDIHFQHIYNRFYGYICYRANKIVKSDVVANAIAQDVFFKLWLSRENMNDLRHAIDFMVSLLKQESKEFYKSTSSRYQTKMLRLDDFEDGYDFLLDDKSFEDDEYLEIEDELSENQKVLLEKVYKVMENLPKNQRDFIALCLKYHFDYGRISYYLGGMPCYLVAHKLEKTIKILKSILINCEKLNSIEVGKKLVFNSDMDAEQSEILRYRYELQYSFEEIANLLQQSQIEVQRKFVLAYKAIKNKAVA